MFHGQRLLAPPPQARPDAHRGRAGERSEQDGGGLARDVDARVGSAVAVEVPSRTDAGSPTTSGAGVKPERQRYRGPTNAEDRPSVKPGTDPGKIITGDPNHWFDASAFELQPQGTIGSTPRNFLRGPGFANVDMSLVKNQALAGNTRLQFRLEVFNVLNRANFAVPTRAVFAGATQNEAPLATAGQVLRTVNSSRQVQLGIKVLF